MKKLLPLLFMGFITLKVEAQVIPPKLWDRTFGGSDEEIFSSVQQTIDGGFISGGWSLSAQSGNKSAGSKGGTDYWVVKTDINGNKLWDYTFGGVGTEKLYSVQQTSDGGYILGGSSNSGIGPDKSQVGRGMEDFWIVKLDANGTKIWDKTFGGNLIDILYSIRQTPDGGYILGGSSGSGLSGDKSQPSQGNLDFWIIKIDASGNMVWNKTYGGDSADDLFSLNLTSDGGFIIVGNSESGQAGDKSNASLGLLDFWILKLNASGIKQWDKTFGGINYDTGYDIQQTSDGGYIVGGISASGIDGNKTQPKKGILDIWVLKLDTFGNKAWEKTFGGSGQSLISNIRQTQDGGFIIGGLSDSGLIGDKSEPNLGGFDSWLIKTDIQGNKVWDKTYGGPNDDYITGLDETTDGGFILGGGSASDISSDKSQNSFGSTDYWLIRLAGNLVGIPENKDSGFHLSQNFPNPFSQNTTVSFNLPRSETVEFTIFNDHGKTVVKLKRKYEAGENQIIWRDLKGSEALPTGNYFYQLKAGNFSETKKMLLIKQ